MATQVSRLLEWSERTSNGEEPPKLWLLSMSTVNLKGTRARKRAEVAPRRPGRRPEGPVGVAVETVSLVVVLPWWRAHREWTPAHVLGEAQPG